LSSFGELEYACGGGGGTTNGKDVRDPTNFVSSSLSPMYLPWDPHHAAQQEFPITTYQPIYYVADSILDALEKLKLFCDTHLEPKKPYTVSYNPTTERIDVQMK
jgi:phenylalanine-4-hydroxylase